MNEDNGIAHFYNPKSWNSWLNDCTPARVPLLNGRMSHGAKCSIVDEMKSWVIFLAAVPAVFLLSSCESTGRYGPGAGHFDTVLVDAGHGGHDSGARARGGSPEKILALDTARRLAEILRGNGFRVIETRTQDYFVPLDNRTAISNSAGAAVFVSIHYNWDRRKGARGMEIYYDSRKSSRLAANILRETLKAYGTPNRGIKKRGFYVLRNNRRPAVLCELGFVSNRSDNRAIQNPAVRQRLAERVASGIIAERNGRNP